MGILVRSCSFALLVGSIVAAVTATAAEDRTQGRSLAELRPDIEALRLSEPVVRTDVSANLSLPEALDPSLIGATGRQQVHSG